MGLSAAVAPERQAEGARDPLVGVSDTSARWRGLFKTLNRWIAIPALRAGLGQWIGTPVGGWLLLLRVRGRKSGRIREVPLSYVIAEDCVWIAAGYGRRADWFQNVVVEPRVDVVLPGRTVACLAEETDDELTRRHIVPMFARAVGVPALLGGINPWRATDDEIMRAMAGVPLIRLRPLGDPIVAGPDDPGGLGWIWRQSVVGLVVVALTRQARSRCRRDRRSPAGRS